METWTLNHPELGLIEFQRGYDADFAELDDTWPEEAQDYKPVPVEAGIKQRIDGILENPSVRARVLLNGEVLHRLRTINNGRYLLEPNLKEDELTTENVGADRSKPQLKVTSNVFNDVLEIEYRKDSEVVLFDPPPGSRGEKRLQAMEASTLKRVGFPILTGLGKGGWAIAVIILTPLISRLVQWLLSLLPDFNINWPTLPTLPTIELPTPNLPQIQLPTPSFNFDINLPPAPDWLLFLLEYSKVWIPILIGIAIGIFALRNYKKSEETKRAWQQKQAAGSSTATSAKAASPGKGASKDAPSAGASASKSSATDGEKTSN